MEQMIYIDYYLLVVKNSIVIWITSKEEVAFICRLLN